VHKVRALETDGRRACPRSLVALLNRDPIVACTVKVEVLEQMIRMSLTGEVLHDVFNSWVLVVMRESYRRKVMEEAMASRTARAEYQQLNSEMQAAERKNNDDRQKTEEALLSKIAMLQTGTWRRDAFVHWRCVTSGLVLPGLRKKAAFSNEEGLVTERTSAGSSRRTRLRRAAFMWWVGYLRALVIRGMLVENWVSARAAAVLQIAWRGWCRELSMKTKYDSEQVAIIVQSCARGHDQVCFHAWDLNRISAPSMLLLCLF